MYVARGRLDSVVRDDRPKALADSERMSIRRSRSLCPRNCTHCSSTAGGLGNNDPERPKNWPKAKKVTNLTIVGVFRFLSPLASTIITPASPDILASFNVHNDTLTSFVVSAFLLGYVFGPLIISPLSETYGRLPLYHINSSLFIIWTVACALAPNLPALIVFRILAGIAGSCPVALGNGSVADCVEADKRGFVYSFYGLCFVQIWRSDMTDLRRQHWDPLLGPRLDLCWEVFLESPLAGDGISGLLR
nr:efflux pump rdc3 [Quercus suber]